MAEPGYDGGMFDLTGTRFDFTVSSGVAETVVLRFLRPGGGEALDLTGASFQCRATGKLTPESLVFPVEHGGETGVLYLSLPALAADEYAYELYATDSAGEIARVLYGVASALSTEHAAELVDGAKAATLRSLIVTLPKAAADPMELRWAASSVAQKAAEEARAAADAAERVVVGVEATVQEAVDRGAETLRAIADETQAAADKAVEDVRATVDAGAADVRALVGQAEAAADRASVSEETARQSLATLEMVDARLATLDGKIKSAIVPNAETNTWWIAGWNTGAQVTGEPGKSPKLSAAGTWMVWNIQTGLWDDTGVAAAGEDGKSPYVNEAGHWCEWDPLTGEYRDTGLAAAGRDGLDGAAVRRIVVDSAEELPTEGPTCHGGVYYYVPIPVKYPAARLRILAEGRTAEDRLSVNGVPIPLPEAALPPAEAVLELEQTLQTAFPEAHVRTEGEAVIWSADVEAWSFEDMPSEGYEIAISVRHESPGYEVYAWLEQTDGSAGWHCVGEANDFATTEIYGLVKLATDAVVAKGAPVGKNEAGGLSVPKADYTLPGSVQLAAADVLETGGALGRDAEGRARVETATSARFGAVKLSMSETAACGCIGTMPDGTIGTRWASLHAAGSVRLGSEFGQLNPIPYQHGVGATPDHQLANNLLFGGAMQHMKPSGWSNKDMEWLDGQMTATPQYFNASDWYMGLVTSHQFAQAPSTGLTLQPASSTLLAGVYLATGIADRRPAAVMTAGTLAAHLDATYYAKGETYTRAQVETHDAQTLASANAYTDQRLQNYYTKKEVEQRDSQTLASANETTRVRLLSYDTRNDAHEWVRDNFHSKTYADATYATKTELAALDADTVHKTPTWSGDTVMTEEEYNELVKTKAPDPKKIYLLI